MRWKPRTKPEIGDIRVRRRFALFPTKVTLYGNENVEYYVWLEWYIQKQKYKETYTYVPEMGEMYVIKWVTMEKYI